MAENLSLDPLTYYHLRVTWSQANHIAKIFLDGQEIASLEWTGSISEDYDPLNTPYMFFFANQNQALGMLLDELRIYNRYMPDEFTPPTSATKPFSQNQPKAKLSVDSGFNNAVWWLSELGFLNETDFNNGGIKIRLDADNDNSPNFSGDLLSLNQVRNLGPLSGRYLHLEFSFISDGDTQRVLYSGKVGLKSQPLILNRREPEIIPRF